MPDAAAVAGRLVVGQRNVERGIRRIGAGQHPVERVVGEVGDGEGRLFAEVAVLVEPVHGRAAVGADLADGLAEAVIDVGGRVALAVCDGQRPVVRVVGDGDGIEDGVFIGLQAVERVERLVRDVAQRIGDGEDVAVGVVAVGRRLADAANVGQHPAERVERGGVLARGRAAAASSKASASGSPPNCR